MKKIRLGVVGTGLIWEHTHMPALNVYPELYEVLALCARRPEAADKWRKQYPGARIYSDYSELVQDENIDAVVVCTPIPLNGAVTIAALKAGKHVFEEKPIAVNYAEAQAVLQAQKESGKNVFALEQVLFDAKMQLVKDYVKNKTLGDPVMFEMLSHFILDPENDTTIGFSKTEWRIHPEFPLGTILDGGAHDLAVITSLFGMPKTVFASGARLRPEMGEYDHILTAFSFGGGLSGFLSHSAFLGGSNNYFNIRFTEGSLYLKGGDFIAERKTGAKETIQLEQRNSHHVMWERLAKEYWGELQPVFSTGAAAGTLKIFDAIAESLKTNSSVLL